MDCINTVTQTCSPGVTGALFSNLLGTLLAAQCAISPTYPEDIGKNHYDAYDFIVVGAGSSGSAVAAKLAQDSNYKILLVEAGNNPPQNSDIPGLFTTLQKTEYDWNYIMEKQKYACKGMEHDRCNDPRGKMLGGSSSMNVMVYIRGLKKDYDEWESFGNKGWGWDSVESYYESQYKRLQLEEYNIGPVNQITEVKEILFTAAEELGFKRVISDDERLNSHSGYFKALASIKNGTRNNAAKQFLGEINNKENLHVLKNAHVGKVIIDSVTKHVEGVEVWVDEKWTVIKSNKEVILSAGALNTPQILMLSGIGPKDHLESLGISVLKNSKVGMNLQDHSATFGIFHGLQLNLGKLSKEDQLNQLYVYLTERKGLLRSPGLIDFIGLINVNDEKSEEPNIQLIHGFIPQNDFESLLIIKTLSGFKNEIIDLIYDLNKNQSILLQVTVLLKPKSRGSVQLQNKDPFAPPVIDRNYFSNPDDLDVVLKGLKHSIKMGETKVMKKLKAKLLNIGIPECNSYEVESNEYLKCIIFHTTSTLYHPVGTAKMGTGEDGVVDYKLKVKGIKGLRVADASIMPTIISANTNAACMMIGEKAGDIILQDWENKIEREEL